MELSKNKELFANPFNSYTQALLSSVTVSDPDRKRKKIVLKGQLPSPVNLPSGCCSHAWCSERMGICLLDKPEFQEVRDGHLVACHKF